MISTLVFIIILLATFIVAFVCGYFISANKSSKKKAKEKVRWGKIVNSILIDVDKLKGEIE